MNVKLSAQHRIVANIFSVAVVVISLLILNSPNCQAQLYERGSIAGTPSKNSFKLNVSTPAAMGPEVVGVKTSQSAKVNPGVIDQIGRVRSSVQSLNGMNYVLPGPSHSNR